MKNHMDMFCPKLIVTDLDGSALKNDKTISEATKNAFAKCRQKGIPIAIATARYITGATPYATALSADYRILVDGTLAYKGNDLIYSNAMSLSVTNQILQMLIEKNCLSHIAIPTTKGLFRYPENTLSDENSFFFDIHEPFLYEANKMVVQLPCASIAEEIADTCHCSFFQYRGEDRYTFYDLTAGKKNAISFLAKYLDISLSDVLVFGDDINDIEMISACGLGVAMGNALPAVKAAANKITLSNEEDGIAVFLNQFILH